MLNPFSTRKILKKGLPGRATVVSSSVPERGATSFNMAMTLQVHVEGITPYEVEDQWMVKAKDTEFLGSFPLPIKVDAENHDKVAIDWDQFRQEAAEQKSARQQALADGGAGAAQGATPVIDMQNDPELRHKIEQVLGRTLTPGSTETIAENDPQLQMRIMQVVQQHAAEKAAGAGASGFASDAGGGGGDPEAERIAQLERLASLKDSGALSDKEFEAEKNKILGG
jgi:hypothetical protein